MTSLKGDHKRWFSRLRPIICSCDLSSLVVGEEKEGMKMEDGGWPGLDRDGWEPLWFGTLVLLHPAGQVPGTTLTDLKGDTAKG